MSNLKAEIKSFCLEYEFPSMATESLLNTFAELKKTEMYPLFESYVTLYETDDPSFTHSKAISAVEKIGENTGIDTYALNMLLFICYAKHCRELYDQAEIPVKIYHDAMKDLKYKLEECKRVYGVWGTFVPNWFPRFFELSRFALGRLQYEDDPSTEVYSKNGIELNYGDWVLNVHIPSGGRLSMDDCLDSFRAAAEFYQDRFPDGVAKFRCHSWLLAPIHKDYLPPETGIRKFADLFDVVRSFPSEKYSNLWRIFGKPYEGSLENFPAETSLQRAYLKLLSDGKTPESGLGYLFLKDGEIIH